MDRPGTRSSAWAAAAFLLAIALLALIAPSQMAQGEEFPPKIDVLIDGGDAFQSVDVSYGRVTVTVRGTVQVEKETVRPETIHMVIEGTPWEWAINPMDHTVSGMIDSFSFTGTVTVPDAASEAEHTAQVVAVWYDKDSVPHKASGDFTIAVTAVPFQLSIDPASLPLVPGETRTVTVTVVDNSPLGVTYLAQIDSLTSAKPLAWLDWSVASLPTTRLQLGSGEARTFDLRVGAPQNATDGEFLVSVKVTVEDHPQHTRTADLAVQVTAVPVKDPDGRDGDDDDSWLPFDPLWLWFGIGLGVLVGMVGFFGFTEVGMLALLWTLLLPLFSRLKRDEVLNQFTRGEIYGFIKANPGVHLTAIKENLGLANGVLAYHLKVLVREEFIVARREGGYKRFYPTDMRVPRKRVHFTRLQLDIVEKLRMHPGLTQVALARMLEESKQVINYNVSVLMAADIVRVEREGSRTRCYMSRDAPKELEEEEPVYEVEPEPSKGSPSRMKS